MFGFGNNSETTATTPPAPAVQPAAPAPAPSTPAPTAMTPPVAAPIDTTTGGANITLSDLITGTGTPPEMTDADFTAQVMEQMQNASPETQQGVPSFDADKLAAALNGGTDAQGNPTAPAMDLMNGVDVNAFVEGLQGEDPANAAKAFAQQVQNNVVVGMAPLINQLVASAIEHSQNASVKETHQSLTASAVVSSFQQKYAYSSNPAIKQMLTGVVNQFAQSAPKGTPPAVIADKVHRFFQGMGQGMNMETIQSSTGPSSDMNDLFK